MKKLVRLFFIINKLLEKPYIVSQLQRDYIKTFDIDLNPKEIYKDIRQLRNLGFEISGIKRPKTNAKEFKIEKTPFNYFLKDEEKELIKDIFSTYSNNKIVLTGLFEHLSFLLNFNLQEIIEDKYNKPINNQDLYIKSKNVILRAKLERKKISFLYKPIGKKEKSLSGFPCLFEIDKKKVERFMIYIPELPEENRYLEFNVDRLVEIPKILNETMLGDFVAIYAKFKLYPPTSNSYHMMPGETEESRFEDGTVIIKSRYYTAFRLIQKLFKYGDTVEIIEPDTARNDMKQKILNMRKLYFDSH